MTQRVRDPRRLAGLSFVLLLVVGAQFSSVCAIDTVLIADGFEEPCWLTSPPGDFRRLFVVEQRGVVKCLNLLTGDVNPRPFLDIQDRVRFEIECGLQAIAFPPDFATSGYFFAKYSNLKGDSIIARFSVDSEDPDLANPASEEIVLTLPSSESVFHKGGPLLFGPLDGLLYIPFGDGLACCGGPAQDPTNLHGKLLRIDVSRVPYSIPPDNPFTAENDPHDAVRDEIWALGLRNPYRMSFDSLTGDLYIADVGFNSKEEINFEPAGLPGGRNYGWACREGDGCAGLLGCCDDAEFTDPIYSYDHTVGRCVIGGRVYRGTAIEALQGAYLFADFNFRKAWSFVYDGNAISGFVDRTEQLGVGLDADIVWLVAFCEDAYGEMYLVDRGAGTNGIGNARGEIHKVIPDDLQDRDCNGNYIADAEEIAVGVTADINTNGIPDECEDPDTDSDGDGIPDFADNCPLLANPDQLDCNKDGLGDLCAIASGSSDDCNENDIPDDCESVGPQITTQPLSAAVCVGDAISFSVVALSDIALSYQWRKSGRDIPGATTSSYSIDPVMASDFGEYDVLVSDDCASIASAVVTLSECDGSPDFIRGDVDGDGNFEALSDSLALLLYGFGGAGVPPCLEALDADDDGVLDPLGDALFLLDHGFTNGRPPDPPFPGCGEDPEPESSLGCSATDCP